MRIKGVLRTVMLSAGPCRATTSDFIELMASAIWLGVRAARTERGTAIKAMLAMMERRETILSRASVSPALKGLLVN
jgi:hypothetical protein